MKVRVKVTEKQGQIQGKLDLVRVSAELELPGSYGIGKMN